MHGQRGSPPSSAEYRDLTDMRLLNWGQTEGQTWGQTEGQTWGQTEGQTWGQTEGQTLQPLYSR
jgi:hypothetical protein